MTKFVHLTGYNERNHFYTNPDHVIFVKASSAVAGQCTVTTADGAFLVKGSAEEILALLTTAQP